MIVRAAAPSTGPPRPAINVPVEVRLALIIGVVAGLGAVVIMGALTG